MISFTECIPENFRYAKNTSYSPKIVQSEIKKNRKYGGIYEKLYFEQWK